MDRRPLRILCFGDSLTTGHTQSGLCFHPYHQALTRLLEVAIPGLEVDIDGDGVDGDTTNHFPSRMTTAYRQRVRDVPYDWVIVLGGTNDLALSIRPETIFENLERTWSYAKARQSRVLALTVPGTAIVSQLSVFAQMNERRDRLNELIRGYSSSKVHVFDFKNAFSYEAMTDAERKHYWDEDRVHLTEAGYDRMGALIATTLVGILKSEDDSAVGTQLTTRNAVRTRKRKVFKDDDATFVEEGGSADSLRRGYVVVRRKDLD